MTTKAAALHALEAEYERLGHAIRRQVIERNELQERITRLRLSFTQADADAFAGLGRG